MSAALQLELPFLGVERQPVQNAIVEVVLDERERRVRVRPLDLEGWVRFPNHLREPGAVFRVETLVPLRGGAWAARGKIRRLRGRRRSP